MHLEGKPSRACLLAVGAVRNRAITTIEGASFQDHAAQARRASSMPSVGDVYLDVEIATLANYLTVRERERDSLKIEISSTDCRQKYRVAQLWITCRENVQAVGYSCNHRGRIRGHNAARSGRQNCGGKHNFCWNNVEVASRVVGRSTREK